MQRLLVIRGGALGDMVLTLPALGALRRAFPEATITLLGHPGRAVLARHPRYVNEVVDSEAWEMYRLFSQPATVTDHIVDRLQSYSLILSYGPTPEAPLSQNLRHYCPGTVLTWQPHPPAGVHITDHLAQPVRCFLQQPYDPWPRVYLDPGAEAAVAHFWRTAGLPPHGVLAIHPGSGGLYKLWPLAGWQQVMAWAAQRGLPGLIISGPAESERLQPLWHDQAHLGWVQAHNLPLTHLAALLARCQVVLGHDSGVTHLAAAVGTTTLALFGPTAPATWGPRSPRACILQPCPASPLTLSTLRPEVVIDTLAALRDGTFPFTPSPLGYTLMHPP